MLSLVYLIACVIFNNYGAVWASPMPHLSEHPLLLVVSFDGFRYDYLTKTDTPNFDRLISDGVTVPWIEARFTTKTFPNHHSIATGVYEETHGIVANNFYDPVLNQSFDLDYTGAEWWDVDGVIPVYTANQMAGSGRHSGGMMWPGTNAWIKNQTCDAFHDYDDSISWFWRVDTVINWFLDPARPVNVVYLYFEEPDSTAHTYGPDSEEVIEQIQRADNITGYLRSRLESVGLWDQINLIITSDHGMASVPHENVIYMADIIDTSTFQYYGSSPVYSIQANDPADNDAIYEILYNASLTRPYTVYKKEDIPEVYHYQNNRRILPILIVADDTWDIADDIYWNSK
ncbi:Bis(5'-adenosyl)-triphosphatase enpp4, variant 2 [Chamberlinius hualienensis]